MSGDRECSVLDEHIFGYTEGSLYITIYYTSWQYEQNDVISWYFTFKTTFSDILCMTMQSPTNGNIALESYDAKIRSITVATYSCNTEYTLVGNEQRTCQHGVWLGTEPSCQGKSPGGINLMSIIIIIIIFIYRGFTTSAQPDIPCKLFKTYLPMGAHLLVGFIC